MADDDVDIYEDLANFGEKSNEDYSEKTLELKKKCADLENKVTDLEKEVESLKKIKNTLEVNLSSLVKTAKTEIARKDRMIAELRNEIENSVFHRSNYRIPKINRDNHIQSTPTIKQTQITNNSMAKQETASTHINNIGTSLKPFITVKNNGDNDNNDDDGGETYQPDKFVNTIYGERLRKKIMEQDALEKLKKEQLKLDALESVKAENKNEANTSLVNVNRDDKENQFNQVALNEENVEIPTKISLKRSNDEMFNEYCDKRQKVNHENKNIDKKDDEKSELINIPVPYETNEKINHRLEPIELRLINLSQKHDEELSVEKQSNNLRDNYCDKYHRRRSNSRSKSRDSNIKRNSSRSREPNRKYDSNKSDRHHSGNNRSIQNKSENHHDSRKKKAGNPSCSSRKEIYSRNHNNYYGRHKYGREYDWKYKTKSERKPRERYERSSRTQYNQINSHVRNARNTDRKKRSRSRSSAEAFNDKSNDSINSKKFKIRASPKVKDNVVIENELASNISSLEEGEIVDSPKLRSPKNMFNTVISEEDLDKTKLHKTNNHLLVMLSMDTPKIDITNHNYPKSPQEENIENIAGFIKNLTHPNESNDILSTVKIKFSDFQTDNFCNTTTEVVKALEYEVNENTRIDNSESIQATQNVVELCKNNNYQESQEVPLNQSPSGISENTKTINNLLFESKFADISINKISAPYADILSKYARKKKSTTIDSDSVIPEENFGSLTQISDGNDVAKSGTIINNESVSHSEQNQVHVKCEKKQEKMDKTSEVVVTESLRDLSCKKDTILPINSQNTSEIQENVTDNEKIHTVQVINAKLETSNAAEKLPNGVSCIDYSEIEIVKQKEIDDIAKEDEKLTLNNNTQIPEDSENNKPVHQVVCTATDSPGELHIVSKEAVGIDDMDNNIMEVENEYIKTKQKESSEVQSENICDLKFQEKTVKYVENTVENCKKIVLTSSQNEKKLVVARRKKRPTQLTNSSSSLTVVLSAYNVNNRICKSKMKTSVTLSDA